MAKDQPTPPEPDVEDATPPTVEELLGTDDPYELVRARTNPDDVNAAVEYTTTRIAALNAGSAVLTKPARDQFGQIVPTKTVLDLRAETTPTDAEADSLPGADKE